MTFIPVQTDAQRRLNKLIKAREPSRKTSLSEAFQKLAPLPKTSPNIVSPPAPEPTPSFSGGPKGLDPAPTAKPFVPSSAPPSPGPGKLMRLAEQAFAAEEGQGGIEGRVPTRLELGGQFQPPASPLSGAARLFGGFPAALAQAVFEPVEATAYAGIRSLDPRSDANPFDIERSLKEYEKASLGVKLGIGLGTGLLPGGAFGKLAKAPKPTIARTVGGAGDKPTLQSIQALYTRGNVPAVREGIEQILGPSTPLVPKPPRPVQVEKLFNMLRSAEPARVVTEEMKHAARQRQAAVLGRIFEEGGVEALPKAKSSLTGQLPKAAFQPTQPLSTEDIGFLADQINFSDLRPFTKLDTRVALAKLLAGEIPTTGEIKRLGEFFGNDIIDLVMPLRTRGARNLDTVLDILNIPRALLSSFDLSAPMRQGIVLGPGHPKEFLGAFPPMIKAFGKESWAKAADDVIRQDAMFPVADEVGLFIAERSGGLAAREEGFMTRFASRIPGLRQSERAYVTYLNKLRFDVFKQQAKEWGVQALPDGGIAIQAGKNIDDLVSIAKFINIASGRGQLGETLGQMAPILNAGFFSPRFLASRLQLPFQPFMASPAARKMVAKDLAAFVGTGIGILTLIKLSGQGSVELNPLSSNFGKIQIGSTKIDFWGGLQPAARYVAQLMVGKRKTTGAGEFRDVNRLAVLGRFVQSKLSPAVGLGVDILRGESFIGEKLTRDPKNVGKQAFNRLTPMFARDVAEGVMESGTSGGLLALPGGVGVGVQTFTTIRDKQDDVAVQLFNKLYDDLNDDERLEVGEHPVVQAKIREFEGKREIDPRVQTTVAMKQWDDTKIALEEQLAEAISAGASGAELRQAIQDFKHDRATVSESLFTAVVEDVLSGNRDILIEDTLREEYWSAEPTFDPRTGDLDFTPQEQKRAEILARATYVSASHDMTAPEFANYITKRGNRFTDPDVARVVEAYEIDQEALKPYWKVNDRMPELLNLDQAFRNVWSQYLAGTKTEKDQLRSQVRGILRARDRERLRLRLDNPSIDRILNKWGYVSRSLEQPTGSQAAAPPPTAAKGPRSLLEALQAVR